MVLDEITGEVVNLKLFTARSKQRALKLLPCVSSAHANIQVERSEPNRYISSIQKRKFRALEEGDIVEKKLCF